MGIILGILAGGAVAAGAALVGSIIHQSIQEENRRKNTPCLFEDGISQDDFCRIIEHSSKQFKRLKSFSIEGPVVHGVVLSQSGQSEWHFSIDFNDYGHITGKYWIHSGNADSNLPSAFAKRIKEELGFNDDKEK